MGEEEDGEGDGGMDEREVSEVEDMRRRRRMRVGRWELRSKEALEEVAWRKEGRMDGLDGEILSSTRPADELAEWGMGPMSEGGRWFEVRSWKG